MNLPPFACERQLLHRRTAPRIGRPPDDLLQGTQVLAVEHLGRLSPDCVPLDPEQPHSRGVDGFDLPVRPDRHDTGGNPFENGFDVTAPLLDFEVLSLELQTRPFELLLAGRELPGHRVEGFDQRTELVAGFGFDAVIEAPRPDFPGARRQHLDRSGDAFREIQPHPGGAHQDHERHHQKDREIHTLESRTHDEQLSIIFESISNAPRLLLDAAR